MKKNKFIGTGVALVTPFNEDGSVDYVSLRNLINFDLENGSDFMVALGTTSESPTLDDDEKRKVVKTVVNTVAGRGPVL